MYKINTILPMYATELQLNIIYNICVCFTLYNTLVLVCTPHFPETLPPCVHHTIHARIVCHDDTCHRYVYELMNTCE